MSYAFERRTELSRYEEEAIEAVFKHYDKSGDEQINTKELERAMLDVIPDASLDIQAIIDDLDADGDNMISFSEFHAAVSKLLLGAESVDDVQRAFTYMDRDRNGFLSPPELKRLLTTTGGSPLTIEEAEDLIVMADKDGDGVLNYKEFCHFLCGSMSEKEKSRVAQEEAKRAAEEAKKSGTAEGVQEYHTEGEGTAVAA